MVSIMSVTQLAKNVLETFKTRDNMPIEAN